MLKLLRTSGIGPARKLEAEFAPRINVITGDNGLGKSFLLDVAWWVLSRTWWGMPAWPDPSFKGTPAISFGFDGQTKKNAYESRFKWTERKWEAKRGRPANPGLVIYARVDGGFSVWDPARNYYKTLKGRETPERPPAYQLGPPVIWGESAANGRAPCNGLIADWGAWQKENGEAYRLLRAALEALSPDDHEKLIPGKLVRIDLDDPRDIPTLRMPYGIDVPVTHASAAVKRIIALAYVLVWGWQEHLRAADFMRVKSANQIIFLVDEIEAHLHPRWQRQVFHALLRVMAELTGNERVKVQVIAATHSPLILASLEPIFDEKKDAQFDLELLPNPGGASEVALRRVEWRRRGEIGNWLTSEAFGLSSSRSLEAEKALADAEAAMHSESADAAKARQVDIKLRAVLGDTDPYWLRWRYVAERKGWLKP